MQGFNYRGFVWGLWAMGVILRVLYLLTWSQ